MTNIFYDENTGIYAAAKSQVQLPLHPHTDFIKYAFSSSYGDDAAVAIMDGQTGRSLSRAQLRSSIQSLASRIQRALGVQKGDVVVLLLPNMLLFPVLFGAILKLGAVAAMANPLSAPQEIEKQVESSAAKIIFTSKMGMSKLRTAGSKSPLVVLVDENSLDVVLPTPSRNFPTIPVRIRQSDPAALLYSSGTTGVSKGVVISHGNLIAAMATTASSPGEMEPWDKILVLFPMNSMGGLVWLACGSVFGKSQFLFLQRYDLTQTMAAIHKYRVTKITMAPPVALDFLNSQLSSRYDLSSLKTLICAAAPLAKDTMEAVLMKFPHLTEFIQLYGMTESTTLGSGGAGPLGSAGILKGLEAKVMDLETRKPLPRKQRGELLLRGPSIMQGYLNNPIATAEAIDEDGWLHTGDLVYFDDDGYLYIVDRLKELIKYKGHQVAPAELEAILLTHPDITDCAVIPFPDAAAGEIPQACVVRSNNQLSSKDVMDFISSQVSPYKKVRRVAFLDRIPKSAAGKILRKELKLQFVSRL